MWTNSRRDTSSTGDQAGISPRAVPDRRPRDRLPEKARRLAAENALRLRGDAHGSVKLSIQFPAHEAM